MMCGCSEDRWETHFKTSLPERNFPHASSKVKARVWGSADYLSGWRGAGPDLAQPLFQPVILSVWPFDDLFRGFAILEIMTGLIFMAFTSFSRIRCRKLKVGVRSGDSGFFPPPTTAWHRPLWATRTGEDRWCWAEQNGVCAAVIC